MGSGLSRKRKWRMTQRFGSYRRSHQPTETSRDAGSSLPPVPMQNGCVASNNGPSQYDVLTGVQRSRSDDEYADYADLSFDTLEILDNRGPGPTNSQDGTFHDENHETEGGGDRVDGEADDDDDDGGRHVNHSDDDDDDDNDYICTDYYVHSEMHVHDDITIEKRQRESQANTTVVRHRPTCPPMRTIRPTSLQLGTNVIRISPCGSSLNTTGEISPGGSSSNTTRQSSDRSYSPLSLHSDGFGRQYSVKVGALGGAFHGSQLSLSGSIPGGVLSESLTLEFIREDPDSYQDGIGPERKIISGVFHILPTGTTFNKEILVRFAHTGQSSWTTDKFKRRSLLYSQTMPGDKPKWRAIQMNSRVVTAPIRALITEQEICLFLTRCCMFVAVEQDVETKYVVAEVYGRRCVDGTVKLTLILSPDQSGEHNVCYGQLLARHDVCLVSDIRHVRVTVKDVNDRWILGTSQQSTTKLDTRYLWNNRSQTATFILREREGLSHQALLVDIFIEHDDVTSIPLGEELADLLSPRVHQSLGAMGQSYPLQDKSHPLLDKSHPLQDKSHPLLDKSNPLLDKSHPVQDAENQKHGCHQVEAGRVTSAVPIVSSVDPERDRTNPGSANDQGRSHEADKLDNTRPEPGQNKTNPEKSPSLFVKSNLEQSESSDIVPMNLNTIAPTDNQSKPIRHISTNYMHNNRGVANPADKDTSITHVPKLTPRQKASLSSLLDKDSYDGHNWRGLCEHLGYKELETLFEQEGSPSSLLLMMWESENTGGGDISRLVACLERANCHDAAAIVRQA